MERDLHVVLLLHFLFYYFSLHYPHSLVAYIEYTYTCIRILQQ